ncbi:hypothetical protein FRX31_005366 [Thalictrum thalictroides]|uniref:Uncharacterized protein n=1 Tax=Thalictrum thalictroides TaxID=46969 RepID=A0A7J6X984_THATH|nr:hypothetical protein FRX31_005366 [Thalictrum thalictroides]
MYVIPMDCFFDEDKDFSHTSFIYNMLLKEPVVMLPPVEEFLIYHPNIGIGLSYNGLPNRHYKVVCFFCDVQGKKFVGHKGNMHYKIYSSETGEWRKDQAKFLNSSILYNTNVREAWSFQGKMKKQLSQKLVLWMNVYGCQKDVCIIVIVTRRGFTYGLESREKR